MPVIAIGAAVAASVVAGSAVAATVGGIAAISAVTAFEVVAAVGATVAAVGAVTRDKTLTMVGGAIGIIGGIGGLAAGAGVLGSAAASGAPIFGPAPAASAAAGSAADTGATFADSLTPATTGTAAGAVDSGVWDPVAASTSAADAASSNTIPFVANGLPPGQSDIQTFSSVSDQAANPADTLATKVNPASGLINGSAPTGWIDPATGLATGTTTNPTETGAMNLAPGAGGGTTPIDTPTPPPGNLGTVDPNTGETVTSAVDPATGKIVSMPDGGSKSIFGQVLGWAQKNPMMASGVMTVGGKLLEGLTSTVTPAQVNALNAQAAANDAAAALTNMQRANLQMPKAVASTQPVTGAPGQIIPSSGAPGGPGIINQPRLAPVTGAPA